MPELLGGDLAAMLGAHVAGVVVLVAATVGERHDVVDDRRLGRPPVGEAQLAKAVGSS
ncbi:hypothetical protein FHS97_003278 [Sphingomonas endophytica]|uniref:Uncharacterized protein n=1 Tax=Sphingomonas endophytica TaxID=869719 RepID=A0ABR6N945_9SPHN|nr:hypothetical protein [Sphingomonas endophytica]